MPSVILDKGVDVQDVDNVTLTPISKPVIAKDLISWHGNDNDNVVGYSLYEKDKRLNEKVLKQNYYSAKGDPIVKPVIRGGYETVYGSQGSQNRLEAHLPMSFTFDIYPNPFVAQIRINYAVPKQTLVEMVIYDVSGRQVKTLVNDTNKPGYYDIIWDGSDNKGRTIPSGIYFIRFAADPIGESDAFRAQDKILLVK